MAVYGNWGQGAFGSSPGNPSVMLDPDKMQAGWQQERLQGQAQQSALEQMRQQQQYAAQQAAADRQFQAEQAGQNRTFQGQLLEAQGNNQRATDAQKFGFDRSMAADQFGYTTKLADQNNTALSARQQADIAGQRSLAGDQFGYTRQLADQQNAFQRGLLQLQQGGQSALSAQEAAQTLTRDEKQFGYTSQLNQGLYANQQAMQGRELGNRLDIAKLNDSGETGRLGMSLAQQRYATDTNAAVQREGYGSQERIAAMPIDFARQKFQATFPLFQQMLAGGGGSGTGMMDPASVKGTTTAPTQVYTPQQIDEQVNAQMASNARRAAGASTAVQQSAAARGLSSQSAATQGQLQGIEAARMGDDSTSRRETGFQAALANANQANQAAALAEQNRQANLSAIMNQRQMQQSGYNARLAALAGII